MSSGKTQNFINRQYNYYFKVLNELTFGWLSSMNIATVTMGYLFLNSFFLGCIHGISWVTFDWSFFMRWSLHEIVNGFQFLHLQKRWLRKKLFLNSCFLATCTLVFDSGTVLNSGAATEMLPLNSDFTHLACCQMQLSVLKCRLQSNKSMLWNCGFMETCN